VTYAYAQSTGPAVVGLSLSIGRGESVALVGPSGSGKSTVLKLMDALLLPTDGTVTVAGMDTRDESRLWEIRRRVGLIFQNPDNQLVSTTVERELAFGMENLGLERREIARRIEDMADLFQLRPLLGRPPHELSGGEKQRVAVAAVLAMRPDCLALDEPTSLLDGQGRREIWEMLRALGDDPGRTVVHVTQFPDEIVLSRRVVVMQRGRSVFDGTPVQLFTGTASLEDWGLRRPASARLADRLRRAGYPVEKGLPALDDLVESVARGCRSR
jgi:energy-coupling factor transport system ATP-binding protein